MSSRRDFLKLTAAAAAGCFLPACSKAQNFNSVDAVDSSGREKPNIIFLLADDLGYADLSSTGSDLHQTPNLDKLKSESMWFTNAYSCHSTCAPSRLGYMTGKYPARLGVVNNHVGGALKGQYTLAQAMKENGYQTCHIGKWHIGNGDQRPELRGFDKSIGSNQVGMPASYHYPFGTRGDKAVPDLKEFSKGDFLTDCLTVKAVEYIKDHKNNPFFLSFCYYAPHTPIQSTKKKIDKYKKIIRQSENDLRHKNPAYAGLVEHIDDSVGKIMETLDKEGIADNTIIIFFSDNGGIFDNYPLRSRKCTPYEGGDREPMFIKWPGVTKPGDKCSVPVISIDFYPTIVSMAGGKINPKCGKLDGVDLTPLIKKQIDNIDRTLHWFRLPVETHYGSSINMPYQVVLKNDYKLIEKFKTNDEKQNHSYELYNLQNDLSETTNLLAQNGNDPQVQQKFKQLKTEMLKWRSQFIDSVNYDPPYIDGKI